LPVSRLGVRHRLLAGGVRSPRVVPKAVAVPSRDRRAGEKTGRVNASEPLMTPRHSQLTGRWDGDRGDRTWPLAEGARDGQAGATGQMGTAWSRGKEGTQSGRVSSVRNVETPSGSGLLPGRPIVRGAESSGGTGCPRSQCRWPKGGRKPTATGSALRRSLWHNWPDTDPPWPGLQGS
jgi:hypothetical protein